MKWYLKAISLISLIAGELPEIVADGKITLRELIELGAKVAAQLGFDVDDEGYELVQK